MSTEVFCDTTQELPTYFPFEGNGVFEAEIQNSLSEEERKQRITDNIQIILREQSSIGLFRASVKEQSHKEGHYDTCAWVRDNSILGIALSDPYLRDILDPEIYYQAVEASRRNARVILDMFASPRWQKAFKQKIYQARDTNGILHTYIEHPSAAPAIHIKEDTTYCNWFAQNQPDSLGTFIILLHQLRKYHKFNFGKEGQSAVDSTLLYLSKIHIEMFKCIGMWEGREVYSPTPTSTIAIVARALELGVALTHDSRLISRVKKSAFMARAMADKLYPGESTAPEGHSGVDLATLVSMGLRAIDQNPLRFLTRSYRDLWSMHPLGMKRYTNDHFFREGNDNGQEAIWFFALPIKATLFYRRSIYMYENGSVKLARRYFEAGERELQQALSLIRKYGKGPELFQKNQNNVSLTPNINDLLWSRAEVIRALGVSIRARRLMLVS